MKRGLMKGACFLIMSFVLHLFFISFANAGIIEDLFSPFNVSASIKINLAPFITDIGNEILVCENNALSAYFNATDLDADALGIAITPAFPFFVSPTITSAGQVRTQINIFSGILDKSRVDTNLGYRIYQELLSASDGSLIATKQVNITVIEINNAPNLSNIGVQTVWTQGDDSTFYHQAQVSDIEDGNQNSLNFDFNLTFLDNSPRLFNVSTNGTMIFTPNISEINAGIYNLSVYNISLCVEDRGIGNTHVNISNNCGQDGGPIQACDTFSLTITDANRPPNITSYYPLNLS
ncbi:MAG: hypothetical protein AAB969_02855, partial [Patescibacteria group bacterium]